MDRRDFLRTSFLAALSTQLAAAAPGRRPRLLLRNAWQSQNIGDIAHYLGLLELMAKHGLEAEVRLWPGNLENGAGELLARRFPKVIVLKGEEQIATAFQECDFFLHGSSSGFGAWKHAARWHQETGKPFGVMGISITDTDPQLLATLSQAKFAYFRETVSLAKAKELGVTCPVMEFGPDTAFGVVTLRNDPAATAFLQEHGLEEGKFLCCIPRYRYTPIWTIHKERPFDAAKDARNKEMQEQDHAVLREAITAVIKNTDLKVLITCEDQTQIPLGQELLYNPLPAEIKARVVWRPRYWLTDEALSTYVRSAGLFGLEMHSPIMCISSGIPALVGRFDEQTNKGFMWRDIGLNEWLFNMDAPEDRARYASTLLSVVKDPAAARAKVASARQLVQARQTAMLARLGESLKL